MTVGVKVVLRKKNMYQFLEKLIRVSLPLVRDFRGLKPKFDESGNYNLGINDWMIFPEIDYENVPGVRGLNITMSIKNGGHKQTFALLKGMGMPFCDD
jgi:large subunit ribosomal protein L5